MSPGPSGEREPVRAAVISVGGGGLPRRTKTGPQTGHYGGPGRRLPVAREGGERWPSDGC
jgi:hypothetical protein